MPTDALGYAARAARLWVTAKTAVGDWGARYAAARLWARRHCRGQVRGELRLRRKSAAIARQPALPRTHMRLALPHICARIGPSVAPLSSLPLRPASRARVVSRCRTLVRRPAHPLPMTGGPRASRVGSTHPARVSTYPARVSTHPARVSARRFAMHARLNTHKHASTRMRSHRPGRASRARASASRARASEPNERTGARAALRRALPTRELLLSHFLLCPDPPPPPPARAQHP